MASQPTPSPHLTIPAAQRALSPAPSHPFLQPQELDTLGDGDLTLLSLTQASLPPASPILPAQCHPSTCAPTPTVVLRDVSGQVDGAGWSLQIYIWNKCPRTSHYWLNTRDPKIQNALKSATFQVQPCPPHKKNFHIMKLVSSTKLLSTT